MTRSAARSFSITPAMSSWLQQIPGVAFQQEKTLAWLHVHAREVELFKFRCLALSGCFLREPGQKASGQTKRIAALSLGATVNQQDSHA